MGVLSQTTDEAVNRPPAYTDGDGRGYYRASALSMCRNVLYAARMGIDPAMPPEWMQQRFDAGHDHEPLIINKLEARFGVRTYGYQDELVMKVCPTAVTIGHVDAYGTSVDRDGTINITHLNGVLVGKDRGKGVIEPVEYVLDGPAVVDAKAFAKSTFDKYVKGGIQAFPHYVWQQGNYQHAAGLSNLIMAVKNKNDDCLIVDLYTSPVLGKSVIVKKVLEIEKAVREQQEAGLFETFACPQPYDYPCPYFRFHDKKATEGGAGGAGASEDVVDLDESLTAELATLALVYQEQGNAERVANAAKEAARVRMQEIVGRDVRGQPAGDNYLTGYHSTYSYTDWEKIAAELGVEVDEAKQRFNGTAKSSKLSFRVNKTKPRRGK